MPFTGDALVETEEHGRMHVCRLEPGMVIKTMNGCRRIACIILREFTGNIYKMPYETSGSVTANTQIDGKPDEILNWRSVHTANTKIYDIIFECDDMNCVPFKLYGGTVIYSVRKCGLKGRINMGPEIEIPRGIITTRRRDEKGVWHEVFRCMAHELQ